MSNGADPNSLNNPTGGGKMRLPDAQTKPWKELGISRATWYRQNKPENVHRLASNKYLVRQKSWMSSYRCSARTIQRMFFVRRYGIECMWEMAYQERLPLGMLEDIAKWEHEDQQHFIDRLVELARTLPIDSRWESDEAWSIKHFGPVMGLLFPVDPKALKRAARQIRQEIEKSIDEQVRQEIKLPPQTPSP
jgi:hypothetical protein